MKEWDINIYRGILTGYNEAFIINQETRDRLVAASPKNAEIIRPIFDDLLKPFLQQVLKLQLLKKC